MIEKRTYTFNGAMWHLEKVLHLIPDNAKVKIEHKTVNRYRVLVNGFLVAVYDESTGRLDLI